MHISPKIVGFVARTGAKLKGNSPAIFLVSGLVAGAAAVITAARAGTKAAQVEAMLDAELETVENTFSRVEEAHKNGEAIKIIYTEEAKANDIRIAHAHRVWNYIKLYAPTALLEAASITLILLSHGTMKKRVASLTAACATVTDMFNRYRENVRTEFGEDVDRRMRQGVVNKTVETTTVDAETGEATKKKELSTVRKDVPWRSDYAKLYQEGCRGWVKDANQNLLTLRAQEAYCNQKLRQDGFLFLNDVYNLLGIDPTEAGSEVGWIYETQNEIGNNYVDFHIGDSPDFEGGLERNIWLDFNVDGPIRHRIRWAKY